jgi:phosphoserine phosphatase
MPSIPQVLDRQLVQIPFAAATSASAYHRNKAVITNGIISKPITTESSASVSEPTKAIWRSADAVCFDVDSTVCTDEAIDELAKYCGKEKEVSQITKNAMAGKMDFRTALRTRLGIIKPSLQQLQSYMRAHPPKLTPGIKELVALLHQRDIHVYLISGGFRSIIVPVANELNIPAENVFANRLKFYYNGDYAGFDEDEPVSRAGGKGEVVKMLKERNEYSRLVMVGDGATDLQTCPPADAFIGFGGNVVREEMKKSAKWYVMSFKELSEEFTKTGKSK